ncbi:MAG: gene transfer agent family protein [Alphaproteobacteria bacterium]|jgi:hypothetical protein|nr:gene transfer agent family protein [Alphaproteobacteria bacterium]
MHTNEHLGRLVVDIGGETRTLSLPFSALLAVENTLGEGIFALLNRFASGAPRLQDVAVLLREALAANGTTQTLEHLGTLLLQDGIAAHVETATRLLELTFTEALAGKP